MQLAEFEDRAFAETGAAERSYPAALPGALTAQVLFELLEKSGDGFALVDAIDGTYLHVNEAGCRMLDQSLEALLGRTSTWPVPVHASGQFATQLRGRDFTYSHTLLESNGRPVQAIQFRDVTAARRREEQLRAFAQSATNIARADSLSTALDHLAADVQQTADMSSCTFLIYDEHGNVRQSGVAGHYPHDQEYLQRLVESRALGAPLLSDDVMRTGKPMVVSGWHDRMLADPRFAPMRSFTERADWDTIAVVPLLLRGRTVGVFNGFYRQGTAPSDDDMRFLISIAEQAAVAVDMFALRERTQLDAAREERGKLARDLHDSVSQMLFTLNLQAAAAARAASGQPVEGALQGMKELSAEAFAAMRELIIGTRPSAHGEAVDFVAMLDQHIAALVACGAADVALDAPDRVLVMPAGMHEQLFRVAQEALHNTTRYAPGAPVKVSLRVDVAHAQIVLEICDRGPGFDAEAAHPGHYGLQNMAERVRSIGGSLQIQSDAAGTIVRAAVPWQGSSNE